MTVLFMTYIILNEDILFYEFLDSTTYWKLEGGRIICYQGEPMEFPPFNIITIYIVIVVTWKLCGILWVK